MFNNHSMHSIYNAAISSDSINPLESDISETLKLCVLSMYNEGPIVNCKNCAKTKEEGELGGCSGTMYRKMQMEMCVITSSP